MTAAASLLLGGAIFIAAFAFSMLGLGGSMFYVPIFKWMGFSLKIVAIPTGLLLNGLTTLSAFLRFWREGLVDFRGGGPAAIAAVIMAPLGARCVLYVPHDLLVLLFALAVLSAAVRSLSVASRAEPTEKRSARRRTIQGASVGGFAGFLAGMIGVGGGFIIAPLLMAQGYRTKEAAATTSFVASLSSFAGFAGHMSHGHLDLRLVAIGVIAVVLGAQLGAWFMSHRARPSWIKRFYGVLLLAVAMRLLLGLWQGGG